MRSGVACGWSTASRTVFDVLECPRVTPTSMRTHWLVPALAVTFAVVLGAPSSARAGACPSCTTNAECEAITGPPAFCVLHTGDVGCGAVRQICCPGQGCNVQTGRPSCETAGTCSVVGGGGASSSASGGVGSSSVGGGSSVAGASSTAAVVSSSAGQASTRSSTGGNDNNGPCACARLPAGGPGWPAGMVAGLSGLRVLLRRRRS